jgi:hypothetical protein
MTEPRNSKHHMTTRQENTDHGSASTNSGVRAMAGRTAYREEYQCDFGRGLDESLDGTESRARILGTRDCYPQPKRIQMVAFAEAAFLYAGGRLA